MSLKLTMMAASAASSIAGMAAMDYYAPQQGVPSQGGQPSAAPHPTNSQPRPVNPGNPVPVNVVPTNQPGAVNPATGVVNPGVQPGVVNPGVYQRPFAFQNPAVEARFTESSRRLVAMEQRLARSNADLTRRLGEARALTGERQTAATFDILQQVLKEQAAMNQYMIRARTAWSGDIEGSVPLTDDDYYATQPGSNPSGGGNQVPAGTPDTTQPQQPPPPR